MFTPNDVYRVIFNKCKFRTQIKYRLARKRFYRSLHVVDFYDVDVDCIIIMKLTDTILQKHKKVKFLNAFGTVITDEGIKHMQLHTLDAMLNRVTYTVRHGMKKLK